MARKDIIADKRERLKMIDETADALRRQLERTRQSLRFYERESRTLRAEIEALRRPVSV